MQRFVVAGGALAAGRTIDELNLDEDVWVSMLLREGLLVTVRGDTVIRAGDEIVVLTDPEQGSDPARWFRAA